MSRFNRNEGSKRQVTDTESKIVFKTTSSFQDIYVVEKSEYEGVSGHFRLLQFDPDVVQGVKNLEDPDCLVSAYSRITVELINHYMSDFKKGYIIGHGIGTISSYYSDKHVLTAEIDPLIVEVSKKYFGHSGKNVEVGDGLEILQTLQHQSQDVIFLDAFSGSGVPVHLTTKEFFNLTKEKVSEKGIILINYIGKTRNDNTLLTLYSRILEIYPYVKLFAANPKKVSKQNIFLIASKSVLEEYVAKEASTINL